MLNDEAVRTTLRDGFVCAWVLARELDAIAAGTDDERLQRLCALLRENYDYPVDSVLLSPDLELLGHVNARGRVLHDASAYGEWLRRAAAGDADAHDVFENVASAAGGLPPATLVLGPDEPSGEVLDAVQQRPFGTPSMRFYTFDVGAFADGGEVVVEVRVGRGVAALRFELHVLSAGDALDRLDAVEPNDTGRLRGAFAAGQRLVLLVRPGPHAVEGDGNAFVAQVRATAR